MSRSETKQPKRHAGWWCTHNDVNTIRAEHDSKKEAEACVRGSAARVVRLVELRPGDMLLSREDAEELRSIVSSPLLLTGQRDRALALLRGRR